MHETFLKKNILHIRNKYALDQNHNPNQLYIYKNLVTGQVFLQELTYKNNSMLKYRRHLDT